LFAPFNDGPQIEAGCGLGVALFLVVFMSLKALLAPFVLFPLDGVLFVALFLVLLLVPDDFDFDFFFKLLMLSELLDDNDITVPTSLLSIDFEIGLFGLNDGEEGLLSFELDESMILFLCVLFFKDLLGRSIPLVNFSAAGELTTFPCVLVDLILRIPLPFALFVIDET
jgi:hypothetical protein